MNLIYILKYIYLNYMKDKEKIMNKNQIIISPNIYIYTKVPLITILILFFYRFKSS